MKHGLSSRACMKSKRAAILSDLGIHSTTAYSAGLLRPWPTPLSWYLWSWMCWGVQQPNTTDVIQTPAAKTIKNKSGTHLQYQFFIKVQRTTIVLLRPAQLVAESTIWWENEKQDKKIQIKMRIRGPTPLQGEGAETESKPALLYFQPWRKEYVGS